MTLTTPDRRANMATTCDLHCMFLVDHFMRDEPDEYTEGDRYELACEIQQTIEDWFRERARARAKAGIDA
jgi:hypothetical protein